VVPVAYTLLAGRAHIDAHGIDVAPSPAAGGAVAVAGRAD